MLTIHIIQISREYHTFKMIFIYNTHVVMSQRLNIRTKQVANRREGGNKDYKLIFAYIIFTNPNHPSCVSPLALPLSLTG